METKDIISILSGIVYMILALLSIYVFNRWPGRRTNTFLVLMWVFFFLIMGTVILVTSIAP